MIQRSIACAVLVGVLASCTQQHLVQTPAPGATATQTPTSSPQRDVAPRADDLQSQHLATSAPATSMPAERIVKPFPKIVVHISPDPAKSFVEVEAETCLDEGFLEQIACSPNSREHESLVVVQPKPSQIHAALLMAGFNPGSPGRWTYENNQLGTITPTGDKINVCVRFTNPQGKVIEQSIRLWIRGVPPSAKEEPDQVKYEEFPDIPWVFGGSQIAPNPKFMGPGEHYVADISGSIIGLVTFGDETIGLSRVLSDQESVQTPEWEVNAPAVPPVETPVTLVLRHWPAS